jgi:hypothetical protein
MDSFEAGCGSRGCEHDLNALGKVKFNVISGAGLV